jgi:hypothetical protein
VSVIQTRCPACSIATGLEPEALLITVLPQHDRAGKVEFTCPSCESRVARSVNGVVVARLRHEGVGFSPEALAHHPSVRGRRVGGPPAADVPPQPAPPLTHDDLLDLHLLLQRDDWIDELQALGE